MWFDYSRLRSTADRLIERFGQPATLHKPGGRDETTYPIVILPGTSSPCTVVVSSYSALERAASLIEEGDVKLMIRADVTPTTADRIEIATATYALQSVRQINPGGTVLYYEAQGRV